MTPAERLKELLNDPEYQKELEKFANRVRHERGGTGTVRAVEYTSTHESNCVWETTSDGRRHLSCDEVEVDWNPPYDKLSASRTSSIYLTKI